jgi:transposase
MVAECRRHPACGLLLKVPTLGVVRIAQLIAAVVTPHRFRSKRQFWSYCGLAVVTRSSAESPHGRRGAAPQAEVTGHARLNHEPQPDAEVRLQERGADGGEV